MNEKILFDTRAVDPSAQLEYCADHVCKTFTNLKVNKVNFSDQGLQGILNQKSFGKVSIVSALAQDVEVQLTRQGISSAIEEILLLTCSTTAVPILSMPDGR